MKAIGLAVTAILLVSQVGMAGAVTLRPAGQYAFTSIDSCEAKFEFLFGSYKTATNGTTNAVREIRSEANGHIGSGVGYLTFKPTSASGGTFTLASTNVHGGALRINNGGVNVTVQADSASGTYSYTATSITFKPTGEPVTTFIMVHGALSASGVPNSLQMVRQDPHGEGQSNDPNNCVETITATR